MADDSDDSVWQKLAKKGYLGTRARTAAEAGDDIGVWDSPKKPHQHTDSCAKGCKKKYD